MSWDVFVSHNRQEKPWVREFVNQLRSMGMRVFFDEDSVPAGAEFQREATEAIAQCKVVVLVISAAAVASPWVADEIDTAFHYKAQTHGRLVVIPVYIQDARVNHPSLAKVSAVYLLRPENRDEAYRLLLGAIIRHTDIPAPESLPPPPPWPGSRSSEPTLAIKEGGRALAVAAHWDDALLGCLGTLLRLRFVHDYQITIAVLCTAYANRYYGSEQPQLTSKIEQIYSHIHSRFGIAYDAGRPADGALVDRAFLEKEDRVHNRIAYLAEKYADCDLIFCPPIDDSHMDHAVTGRLVRSQFRKPHHFVLEYEIKRYTDRSFVPNIFFSLDARSSNGICPGDLKVELLSKLLVYGTDLNDMETGTKIDGSEFIFGRRTLEARLLISALDYSGDKSIRYGEAFRGRISL